MKLSFVLGTRPEILKLAAVVDDARHRGHTCRLLHTGQHYDHAMSAVFFEELGLPEPDVFLEVGSGAHGAQTGAALTRVEETLAKDPPDAVLVVGDTNSTIAGAIAAGKLRLPLVHVESGARSFDWSMPEEINRRIVDAISTVCCAPTDRCLRNLVQEGAGPWSFMVGDTLTDVAHRWAPVAATRGKAKLEEVGLPYKGYALVTTHRSENADDPARLGEIVGALAELPWPVLFPIHPRTRARVESFGLTARLGGRVTLADPTPYLTFSGLVQGAAVVLTDSGGVQEEAAIFGVPCLTLRDNTEWIETVESGANRLVGARKERILAAATAVAAASRPVPAPPFRPGAKAIVDLLEQLHREGQLAVRRSDFLRDGLPALPPA